MSTSLVSQDLTINGKINSKSDVTIEGRVVGDVSCNKLIVNSTGRIEGDIKASVLKNLGTVVGSISCKAVELMAGSETDSNIRCDSISVEHSSILIGKIKSGKNFLNESSTY